MLTAALVWDMSKSGRTDLDGTVDNISSVRHQGLVLLADSFRSGVAYSIIAKSVLPEHRAGKIDRYIRPAATSAWYWVARSFSNWVALVWWLSFADHFSST